jgi:hypothetical protein
MIYDRTQDDIAAAILIYNSKFIKGIELSEDDINALERGAITINTLKRIELMQYKLDKSLKEMLYMGDDTQTKDWVFTDFFYKEDLIRIIDNIKKLRSAFYVYKNTPQNPNPEYNYREFNAIEKILNDIEEIIIFVKQNYKICGEYYCGE